MAAAALYQPPPDLNQLRAFGLTPADIAGHAVEVWPDNWQSLVVFDAMGTQWNVGMGGAIGLQYASLSEVWRRTKTPIADRDDVFDDLRVMEQAALNEIAKQNKGARR